MQVQAAPELRPLGIGDIVDRSFALYRQNFGILLVLAAVPALISTLLNEGGRLLFPDAFFQVDRIDLTDFQGLLRTAQTEAGKDRVGDTIVGLLSSIPQSFSIAALTYAAANLYLGRRVTAGPAMRSAVGLLPRVLFAALAAVLFGLLIWIVLIVVTVLIASLSGIGILVLLPLLCIFVVPLFLLTTYVLAPTIAALEAAGPVRSLARAASLAKGQRWRILGLLALMILIEIVLSALLVAIFVALFALFPSGQRAATILAELIATIAWEPLPWAALAVLYYDLRSRREALDIQLAAEALQRAT